MISLNINKLFLTLLYFLLKVYFPEMPSVIQIRLLKQNLISFDWKCASNVIYSLFIAASITILIKLTYSKTRQTLLQYIILCIIFNVIHD